MRCFKGKLCLFAGNITMNNELRKNKQEKEKKEQQISEDKIGKPGVIARVALFLASHNASNFAGQQFMLM